MYKLKETTIELAKRKGFDSIPSNDSELLRNWLEGKHSAFLSIIENVTFKKFTCSISYISDGFQVVKDLKNSDGNILNWKKREDALEFALNELLIKIEIINQLNLK